jgi:hypothetical protein
MLEGELPHGQFFGQYTKMASTYKGNAKTATSMRHLTVYAISLQYFSYPLWNKYRINKRSLLTSDSNNRPTLMLWGWSLTSLAVDSSALGYWITMFQSIELTNQMQPCNRIYYSKVYWRLNMFRAAYRTSSGALNCICIWLVNSTDSYCDARIHE